MGGEVALYGWHHRVRRRTDRGDLMGTNFFPTREADILTWSVNFASKIAADPSAYGLSAPQSADYGAKHEVFALAYQTANDPDTRSPSNIVAKNTAKKALSDQARMLARIVRADPAVTAQQKAELGLGTPDPEPTPIPAPARRRNWMYSRRWGGPCRLHCAIRPPPRAAASQRVWPALRSSASSAQRRRRESPTGALRGTPRAGLSRSSSTPSFRPARPSG